MNTLSRLVSAFNELLIASYLQNWKDLFWCDYSLQQGGTLVWFPACEESFLALDSTCGYGQKAASPALQTRVMGMSNAINKLFSSLLVQCIIVICLQLFYPK